MHSAGRTLVLLPTYNEVDNLPRLISELLALPADLDVLVIDDLSPDGTGDVADALARSEPRVHVLHRQGPRGLGRAYVAGFAWALARGYGRVVQMDADFSHRPGDLPRLLKASVDHAVVIGSRYVAGGSLGDWSWTRRLLSRFGSLYARLLLGGGPRDYTGGFRVLDARALNALDLAKISSNGYAFQVEVNYACRRAGHPPVEVPICFPDRVRGQSKMSWRIALEAAILVPRLRLGLVHVALRESRVPLPEGC